MDIISCTNLKKKYGDKNCLDGLSFTIKENGCIGFLGPNGAGKTTTIRIIAGLAKKTSGELKILGLDINKDINKIKENIGYCPQSPSFYNNMTAMEWMRFTGEIYKIPKDKITTKAEELLELCGILSVKDKKIVTFSGGMKQRLAIAQALINNPKVLLLDEPVSALDPMGRYDVLNLIEKLKHKMAILMSTHIIDDIERIADNIIIINDGKTILSDSMEGLREKYISPLIEVSFIKDNDNFISKIKDEPWLENIEKHTDVYKLTCTNLDTAAKSLISIIGENDMILKSYSLGQSSLEDIFLKVVK